MHDADFGSAQAAKKALMCIPQPSIAGKTPSSLYYTQQSSLKALYGQYPTLLDQQFSNGGTISPLDACPLLLQTASLPTLSHIGLPHSLESAVMHSASEPPMEVRIDTSKHFHVFVGDLSKDVSNDLLKSAFQKFGEVSEAKVIRDAQTQKSKGYGFVSFPCKQNAENAITGMNGKWIGKRAVRTNWASRKTSEEARDKLTFEQVFNSTKADNTSVYIGNINAKTTDVELRDAFATYGDIAEVRVFKSQRYAFVRFDKKECATKAIMEMNGREIGGNPIRCSWGRTQPVGNTTINGLPIDLSSFMIPTMLPTTIPLLQNPFMNYEPTALLYNSFPQW